MVAQMGVSFQYSKKPKKEELVRAETVKLYLEEAR